MKYTGMLAAGIAVLSATIVFTMRVQAQQEVDPTSYPLTAVVGHPANRATVRPAKQTSAHGAQKSIAKKTKKPVAKGTQNSAAKVVAKR